MDHVVRHVVIEHRVVLEVVVILHLPVEETGVLAQVSSQNHAHHIFAVLVRL